ncbi:MAG TPA: hypothetical protein VGS19_29230 [Streptosporangiaceae bacterium]|nr:hypothetical protein [Streptosporangiaceae bacterium]
MARRVITTVGCPEWAGLFTGFTSSAFRLEGLQHYTAADEQEAFARFQAGLDPGVDLSWWCGLARGHRAAGRRMARVRVVAEPLTDYTRFELAHFPAFVEAGDDIRVIPVASGAWPRGLPRHDFWLFDDHEVWILAYDRAGTFLKAELHKDRRTVTDHLRWREAATRLAIPLREYIATPARQAF